MGQKSKHSAQTKGFPSKEKNQYSLSVLVFSVLIVLQEKNTRTNLSVFLKTH